MEQELEIISDQQKELWNKFSPGWMKWDELMMDFLKPMGDEIVRVLHLKSNDIVLDIASGTGEPGLTIASNLAAGKVILTDLAEDMLEIAAENAARRNITNIETRVCDVSNLPFADDSFDAISCRFGFMFFPDMQLAAKELARVLKPGGRIAVAVWDIPEKNFWISAIMGVINKNMELPAVPAGAPGMFRCARTGVISELFLEAGLTDISEVKIAGKMNCKTTDVYWNLMNDIAASVVNALSKADEAMKATIKAEVYDLLNQKYPDGNVVIDSSATVIYAEKC